MARSVNKVILIGNVGGDPELRYTAGGIAVVSLSLATSEQWKNADGEKQEKTEWHKLTAWRKLAEIFAEYVKKGSKIYIEGKITYETFEKDGKKSYFTKIVVDQLVMLDGKNAGQQHAGAPAHDEDSPPPKADDLPF